MSRRQIKFRAWDNKEKKWLLGYEYPNLGGFSLYGESVVLGEWGGVCSDFLFEKDGRKAEDLIVMQFIGLTDKNGKEIYEGDIVNFLDETLSVEMTDNNAGGKMGFGLVGSDGSECSYHYGTTKEDFTDCEVIGNIYENPELLK